MKHWAFFDLDETLISCKSLLEVFRYYCEHLCKYREKYLVVLEAMRKMKSQHIDRNRINRYFYRNFKGIERECMQKLACSWFKSKLSDPSFFNKSVLARMRKHQAEGGVPVLVSGSFLECVIPIAQYVGIKDYLCIKLEQKHGIYTGNILGPQTIGKGKKQAIEKYIIEKKVDLTNSYAYGDHFSDIPFLQLVEYPVVVGGDPKLLHFAKANNWCVI